MNINYLYLSCDLKTSRKITNGFSSSCLSLNGQKLEMEYNTYINSFPFPSFLLKPRILHISEEDTGSTHTHTKPGKLLDKGKFMWQLGWNLSYFHASLNFRLYFQKQNSFVNLGFWLLCWFLFIVSLEHTQNSGLNYFILITNTTKDENLWILSVLKQSHENRYFWWNFSNSDCQRLAIYKEDLD